VAFAHAKKVALGSVAALLGGACELVGHIEPLHLIDDDAAAPEDARADSDGSENAGDVVDGNVAPADGARLDVAFDGCPPGMVNVQTLCIDSTEVTFGAYWPFVDSGAPQPAQCAWNTSFAPSQTLPDDFPVTGVNWCDAYAFCQWQHKHLCGSVQGGPRPIDEALTSPDNAWFVACQGQAGYAYPYGPVYVQGLCNGVDAASGPWSVTTRTCEGSAKGLFDMSGNVHEWLDSCGDTDAGITCAVVGGDYQTPSPVGVRCGVGHREAMEGMQATGGFRCCLP
jgi:formylglycine-generating enzyme required for sulfatase activity